MSKRILLIDDDSDDAELFSDALDEMGIEAELVHFVDGSLGLENLKEKAIPPPDIIFLDVNMPQINGWDCLREIKNIAGLEQIPIVMYSTSNFAREGITAEDIGAAALLTKPSDFEELKAELSSLFEKVAPFR